MRNTLRHPISLVLLAFVSLITLPTQADPYTFSYGGRMTEAGGRPLKGPINIGVSFYSTETGGALLGSGSQSYANVPLKQGIFQVQISLTPAEYRTVFARFTDPVWVEVVDLTHNKIYPRQRLTAVPYAAVVPVDGNTLTFNASGQLTAGPETPKGAGQFISKDGSGFIWASPPAAGTQLQGIPLSASPPASGEILQFDGTQWVGSALSTGTVTSLSADLPLSVTAGNNPSLSLAAASATQSGYLTGVDWLRFNNKQSPLGYTPLNKAGDTASGTLDMGGSKISSVGAPTSAGDLANKTYVDATLSAFIKLDGSVPLSASWSIGNRDINSVDQIRASTLTTSGQFAAKIDPYGTAAGQVGELRLFELSTSEQNYVGFKAPDLISTSTIWTLPSTPGLPGHVLQTNGASRLAWVDLAAAALSISSVAGKTGVVSLDTDDVAEGPTRLYSTAARVRAATVDDALTDGVSDRAPSQNAVFDQLMLKLSKSGSTMSGALNLSGNDIVNADSVGTGSISTSAQAAITIDPSGSSTGASGKLLFRELSANGTESIGFQAPDSITGHTVWTLPSSDGTIGQLLKTDGSANLGWLGASSASVTDAISDGVTTIAPSQNAVFDALEGKLNLAGGTLSGPLSLSNQKIQNLASPTVAADAASKDYVDSLVVPYLRKDGSTPLTAPWAVGNFGLSGVGSFSATAATVTSIETSAQAAASLAPYGAGSGQTAELRFRALTGTNYVGFKAADSLISNTIWTLPTTDGLADQVLKTDGSKALGFTSGSSLAVADSITDGVTNVAPSQNAVFDSLSAKLDKSGGTLSGPLDLSLQKITNLAAPSSGDDLATKLYTDTTAASLIRQDGTAPLSANWSVGGFALTGVGAFTAGEASVSSLETTAQNAVTLAPYGALTGNTGELQFKELSLVTGHHVGFKAPDAIAANQIWTWPAADGSANQILRTNGAGQLSWTTPSTLSVADFINDAVTTIAPSQNSVFDALTTKVDLAGDLLSGPISMSAFNISGLDSPTAPTDAVNKTYADTLFSSYLRRDGATPLTGNWSVGGLDMTGVSTFTANAATLSSLTTTGQAALTLEPFGSTAGTTSELRYKELSVLQGNYVGFKAPDTLAGNRIWTLPPADGSPEQVLVTNGSGQLAWGSSSTTSVVADSLSNGVTTVAPSQNAVFDALATRLNLSGGTMAGPINLGNQKITGVGTPTLPSDLATMSYADGVVAPLLRTNGSVPLTANWDVGGFSISGVGALGAGATTTGTATTSGQAALTIEPFAAPAGSTGEIRWRELASSGTNFTGFKAPDVIASSRIWTLPAADGAADSLLVTNGSGILGFASASSLTVADAITDGVSSIAPSQNAVFDSLALRLNKSGGTMSGDLAMGNNLIQNLAAPTAATDAATKSYSDTTIGSYLAKAGTTPLTANWAVGNFSISGLTGFSATGTLSAGSLITTAQNAVDIRPFGTNPGQTSQLRFDELSANGSHSSGFKAPDNLTSNTIWELPAVWGASGEVLTSNGSGVLSWTDIRTTSVADSITDGVTSIAPSQNAVFDSLALKLNLAGGTMTGGLNMGSSKITNLASPTLASDTANKSYADSAVTPYLRRDGSVALTGNWAVGGFAISGVADFTAGDATLSSLTTSAQNALVIPPYAAGAGSTSEFRFRALTGSNYVALKAPDSITSNTTWTLPAADGSANFVLRTNGAGVLSWVDASALSVGDSVTSGVTNLAPSENAVFDALALQLDKTGGTLSGPLAMGNNLITGLATPTLANDAATKSYVDAPLSSLLRVNGASPLTSNWALGGYNVSGVGSLSAGATTVSSLSSTGSIAATGFTSSAQAGLTINSYGAGTGTGELRLKERASNGAEYVGLKAPNTIAASKIWTLPSGDGGADSLLKTDGTGLLSWATPSSLLLENAIVSGRTTLAPTENAVFNGVAAELLRTGGTMTGALNLPANGLQVGTASSQLHMSGGNVGILSDTYSTPLAISNGVLGPKISLFGGWSIGIQANLMQFMVSSSVSTYGFTFGAGTSASNTNIARLTGPGLLGIGIAANATPLAPLYVVEPGAAASEVALLTLDSDNGTGGAGPRLNFRNAGAGMMASIAAIDDNAGDGMLHFRTSSDGVTTSTFGTASNRMLIYGNGNVSMKNANTGSVARLEVLDTLGNGNDFPLLILDSDNVNTSQGPGLQFKNAGGGYLGAIAAVPNGNDGRLEFRTSSDSAVSNSVVAASETKMSISSSGNVGMWAAAGVNSNFPLGFGNAAYGGANSPRISLYGNSGTSYFGFGIDTNQLQIVTPPNDRIDFGYGSSGSFTNTARFFNVGKGFLAIGTVANGLNTADSMVHIRGGGLHVQDTSGNTLNGMGFGTCPFAACPYSYETIQMGTNGTGNNFRLMIGTSELFMFAANGVAYKGGTLAWEALSDIRTKDVHRNFTLGLDEVLKLDPIVYSYKENNPRGYDSKEEYVGFSAQAVQKIIPDAIKEDDKGFLNLTADPIIWTLLNGIKDEYHQRVAKADEQSKALKAKRQEIQDVRMQLSARTKRIEKAEMKIDRLLEQICRKDPAACEDRHPE